MAISDETTIELELEYAILKKVRLDLLSGKLKQGYTHTLNGAQSVTYQVTNIGALNERLSVLKEEIALSAGTISRGPVYWS